MSPTIVPVVDEMKEIHFRYFKNFLILILNDWWKFFSGRHAYVMYFETSLVVVLLGLLLTCPLLVDTKGRVGYR
jgi:hypothetical protein